MIIGTDKGAHHTFVRPLLIFPICLVSPPYVGDEITRGNPMLHRQSREHELSQPGFRLLIGPDLCIHFTAACFREKPLVVTVCLLPAQPGSLCADGSDTYR